MHLTTEKTVFLADGRYGNRVIAECCDARTARLVAAALNAFDRVSDSTAMFLLDGGVIRETALAFENEREKAFARLAEDRINDAAALAAAGYAPAQAAE